MDAETSHPNGCLQERLPNVRGNVTVSFATRSENLYNFRNSRSLIMDSFKTPSRRQLMKTLAGVGIGSVVFQRAVVAQAPKEGVLTEEMIKQAEWISGLKLTDPERKALVFRVNSSLRAYERLRKVPLPNDVPPAFAFVPSSTPAERGPRGTVEPTSNAVPKKPDSSADLAFLTVTALSQLVPTRAVSST